MDRSEPFPKGQGEVRWVSTDWLQDHLEDDISLLDTQPDVHDYIRSHIPGAVHLSEVSVRLFRSHLPHVWLGPQIAELIFRQVGVWNRNPVVLYSSQGSHGAGDGLEQAVVAYTLLKLGHKAVYILDGGYQKWRSERKEATPDYPRIEEGDFSAHLRDDLGIEHDDFKELLGRADVVHLDSRPQAVYEGKGAWKKGGHIPGAINLPWTEFMRSENICEMRSQEDMMSALEKAGARKDKLVLCSCGSGRKSACQFLIMKFLLGYPRIRMFENSLTEWLAEGNDTVLGPGAR